VADDHTDVVRHVKADLEQRGVSLVGPCGAFEITRRVAWALRAEGAGLLSKPGGNMCREYATDIVAYRDGTIVDMLVKGGGAEDAQGNPIAGTGNEPAWQINPVKVDPARWRAPWEVLDGVVDVPVVPVPGPLEPPPGPPEPDGFDLAGTLMGLGFQLQQINEKLDAHAAELADVKARQQRGLRGTLFGYSLTLTPPGG